MAKGAKTKLDKERLKHCRAEVVRSMDEWISGWMSIWMDDGCMVAWMDGCIDGWVHGWMGAWMDRNMDGWQMDGWVNGWSSPIHIFSFQESIGSCVRILRPNLTSANVKDKVKLGHDLLMRLKKIMSDPQHGTPDVFIWMIQNRKRFFSF